MERRKKREKVRLMRLVGRLLPVILALMGFDTPAYIPYL